LIAPGITTPPRILFVATEAAFFVTHRLTIALRAREEGYDVHVATPVGRLQEVILANGLQWHRIRVSRRTRLVQEALAVVSLTRLYRRVRPDLVHHIAIKAVLYGTIAARIARVPAVVNAIAGLGYAFDPQRGRSLLGRAVRFAMGVALRHPNMTVIFQNVEDQRRFVDQGWIQASQARLIRGSGVDPSVFRPAGGHVEPERLLVVFASRLLRSKGVEDFVEAARRLAGNQARFAVVGDLDPDNPDSISEEDLEGWRSEGAVEVWGRRTDMPEVLRQTSIFVLPTYYLEGVPRALIEAASSAVPVVTTNTPGCRDIVQHGENGLLVPPRDVDALVTALRILLSDPRRREEMGRLGRIRVLEHFTLDGVVDQTTEIYRTMLARSTSRQGPYGSQRPDE
jgi:glycosyltransferase involved in cell wall biosynthesis